MAKSLALREWRREPPSAVVLRPFEERDVERLIGWLDDEAALFDWAGNELDHPLDPDVLQSYPDDRARSGGLLPFAVYRSAVSPDAVGHVALADEDPRRRSVRLSRVLVGDPADRGQGIGHAIVRSALERAFEALRVNRVWSYVPSGNEAALHCLEGAGFVREGLLRECAVWSGEYVDCHAMSVLRREWEYTRLGDKARPRHAHGVHEEGQLLLPSHTYARVFPRVW